MEDKEAAIAQLLTQMKEYPRDVAEALYETLSGDELSMKINKCEQTIKEKDKQIQNLQEELKKLRAKQKTTSNISEENIT